VLRPLLAALAFFAGTFVAGRFALGAAFFATFFTGAATGFTGFFAVVFTGFLACGAGRP
jgi:hypothetical protein